MEVKGTVVGRRTRVAIGANVAVMVLLAAGIVALANTFAQRSFLRRQFDWTEHARNTLSSKTESVVRGLEETVECSTFFRADDYLLGPIQQEVIQETEALLRLYERANPEKFKRKAYDLGPEGFEEAKAKALEVKLTETNVVVLRQGARQKEVRLDDLADIDRGDMGMFGGGGRGPRLLAFKAEAAITNALISVTQAAERKVLFVTGHGESSPTDTKEEGASRWADLLRKDGCRVEDLDLPEKRAIPEDASAVVLLGPRRAFSPEETRVLQAYLDRGGRLLLAVDPTPRPEELGEPTGLLESWGIKLGRGIACQPLLDILTGGYVHGTPDCATVLARPLATHEITRPLAQAEIDLRVPFSRSLERIGTPPLEVTTANLLETIPGSRAWEDLPEANEWNFQFDKERENESVLTLALAAEREAGEGTATAPAEGGPRKARLVVVGSALCGTNQAILRYGRDLYMNGVNWLLERTSLISIAPKPPEERRIDLRKEGTKSTLVWSCIVLLPALVVAAGTTVWFRRRR
ncbi:MAG: GldG family protein [Planctomycetes bacterium]|nr:GldG family protein [Planctomycetota bacterium]